MLPRYLKVRSHPPLPNFFAHKLDFRILATHSSHRPTLPLHLACTHHLPNLRPRLYLLAQELVKNEPDDAISWYAVGLWYFSGRRWEESRRYFGCVHLTSDQIAEDS